VSCSNDRATIGSYTILLLQSSSSNIPSHSWPNQSSDMAKWHLDKSKCGGAHSKRGARAYNRHLGVEPPVESRGRGPGQGVRSLARPVLVRRAANRGLNHAAKCIYLSAGCSWLNPSTLQRTN